MILVKKTPVFFEGELVIDTYAHRWHQFSHSNEVDMIIGTQFATSRDLEKISLLYRTREDFIRHLLISDTHETGPNKKMFPILTIVNPLKNFTSRCAAFLNVNGINAAHREFSSTWGGGRLVPQIEFMYSAIANALMDTYPLLVIEPYPSGMPILEDRTACSTIHPGTEVEIRDYIIGGMLRNDVFSQDADMEGLMDVAVTVPKEYDHDVLFQLCSAIDTITAGEFDKKFQGELIVNTVKHPLEELMEQRKQQSSFTSSNISEYPGMIEIYDYIIHSGLTEVLLSFSFRNFEWSENKEKRILANSRVDTELTETELEMHLGNLGQLIINNEVLEGTLEDIIFEVYSDEVDAGAAALEIAGAELLVANDEMILSVYTDIAPYSIHVDFAMVALTSQTLMESKQ